MIRNRTYSLTKSPPKPFYLIYNGDDEQAFFSKTELLNWLAERMERPLTHIIHIDLADGTARDVSEDIATEWLALNEHKFDSEADLPDFIQDNARMASAYFSERPRRSDYAEHNTLYHAAQF